MDEMTLTLNSPITEEQWDMIEDVDFEHTDRIYFHTKHGKDVEFVKRKRGTWLPENRTMDAFWVCSSCGFPSETHGANILYKFCPNCGSYNVEDA